MLPAVNSHLYSWLRSSAPALSAMIGPATILLDPVFQGLAISLLFGLFSSTPLTVPVIPAIYVVMRDANRIVAPLTGRRGAKAAVADVD
jgi:hypothetical protein